MQRIAFLLVSTVVSAGVVTACGDDGGSSSGAGYCATAQKFVTASDSFDSVFDTQQPDVADMKKAFTTMARMSSDLLAAAPAEIEQDATVLNDSVQKLVAAFDKLDYDFTKLLADPEAMAVVSAMDSAELDAAGDRIDSYTEKECGFTIGS
jgi:hypothetical protein